MRQAEVAQSTSALLNCNSLYTGLKLDLRSCLRYTVKQPIRLHQAARKKKAAQKPMKKSAAVQQFM